MRGFTLDARMCGMSHLKAETVVERLCGPSIALTLDRDFADEGVRWEGR